MRPVLRRLLAVLCGIVATVIVIMAVETGGHALFPEPAGFDAHDADAAAGYMAALPPAALMIVAAGWLAGVLAGTWVATRVAGARSRGVALAIGGFVVAGAVLNFATIRHPPWFIATSMLMVALAIVFAARVPAGRRRTA